MKTLPSTLLFSRDSGLITHWTKALDSTVTATFDELNPLANIPTSAVTVWVDLSLANLQPWSNPIWHRILQKFQLKVIAASSSPTDEEGMMALDAGCAGYCHAFSDALTLKSIQSVVESGNIWIGRSLMTRLLRNTARLGKSLRVEDDIWSEGLTARELEVARLAANGASNQSIAVQCNITERTVKAHLSAVFEKLHITDRLQLALRVHGI